MLDFAEISNLNQLERDQWVLKCIRKYFTQGNVLDVGAGTSPYKPYLSEFQYIAHDFGKYEGIKLGNTHDYADIQVKSDIADIPLEDGSIDHIVCTEVLEHVPEPLEAIREFARLLRPGGLAMITAPFTSGLHQEPFHFYAGYSPNFYRHAAEKFGFNLIECSAHGGFLRLMSQELGRMCWVLQNLERQGYQSKVNNLGGVLNVLANEMLELDAKAPVREFSIGYHVLLEKKFPKR
jgi:SAM-dependent methyltransferase